MMRDEPQSPSVYARHGARWAITRDGAAWVAERTTSSQTRVVAAHSEAELIGKLDAIEAWRPRGTLRRHQMPDVPEVRRLMRASWLNGFTFGAAYSQREMRVIRSDALAAVAAARALIAEQDESAGSLVPGIPIVLVPFGLRWAIMREQSAWTAEQRIGSAIRVVVGHEPGELAQKLAAIEAGSG
jgi:hypothetical protein